MGADTAALAQCCPCGSSVGALVCMEGAKDCQCQGWTKEAAPEPQVCTSLLPPNGTRLDKIIQPKGCQALGQCPGKWWSHYPWKYFKICVEVALGDMVYLPWQGWVSGWTWSEKSFQPKQFYAFITLEVLGFLEQPNFHRNPSENWTSLKAPLHLSVPQLLICKPVIPLFPFPAW